MRYGRDWAENCFVMSLPKEESEIARVTMMPGCRGDQERGQLGDQAVSDGEGDVRVQSDIQGLPVQRHTDNEAANDLHNRDEDSHLHVPGDELGGAIH